MGPTPTATPRRQSCDRCHSQKLRCSRLDNSRTGACDRCRRQGALCSYSSSLPKGRPSRYRLNEVPAGSKSPRKSPTSPATTPATPVPTTSTTSVLPITPVTPVRADQQYEDSTTDSQAVAADVDADTDVDITHVDMDIDSTGSSLNANTNANGSDAFVLPGSMDMFTDLQASWRWPGDLTGDNMLDMSLNSTFNWDPTTEAQFHSRSEFSGPFSSDSSGTGNSGGSGHDHPLENFLGSDYGLVHSNSMSNNSSSGGGAVFTADKNGFELSIAHLSRLCTRLSQLFRSRCFLAETLDPSHQSKDHDPAREVQPVIETVFKLINSWLVHGSANTNVSLDPGPTRGTRTTGDLLHHVFSASNHLLEILRYLHVSVLSSTSNLSSAPSSSHNSSSHIETATRSPSDASSSSQHSHTVVHHLVLTCMTLLLNIYVTILITLQRSADELSSSLLARNLSEPSDYMDAASRGHIQLVSVVQLCSYFIKRQNQTLDKLLSNTGSLHTPLSGEHNPQQSVSPDSTFRQDIEELSDLKTEVEQRLKRLQESLCIII